MKKENQEQHAS